MMSGTARRLLVLGGAAAIIAGTLVAFRGEGPADPAAPAGLAASAAESAGGAPVAGVRLDLLKGPRGELGDAERNPFRFEARAEPEPERPAMPDAPRPGVGTPPAPTGPPPPPPIPLRFIGLVEAPTQAGRVAILSDGRGNVFHGREGDIIEGRYRVLTLGADVAELAYLDGRGRQTIRLSGQ